MMVSVLACFNIEKARDQNGEEIEIDDEYEEFGLFRYVEISPKMPLSNPRKSIVTRRSTNARSKYDPPKPDSSS